MIIYKTEKVFEKNQLKDLFLSNNWISGNYHERLVKAMKNSDTVISAWDGDKLVGLINAIDDGELTAYVHYLLVNPKYQNLGIGSELVRLFKEKYKGYLSLVLTAEHQGLIKFYEKLGFSVIDGASPMILQTL